MESCWEHMPPSGNIGRPFNHCNIQFHDHDTTLGGRPAGGDVDRE